MEKTVIFFSAETGIAHITRSLAIAEKLHKQGHKVIFALPKRKWELVKGTAVNIVDIPPYTTVDNADIFKTIKDSLMLQNGIKEESKLIDKYKPDIVVVDFRISAMVTAVKYNLPTVYISGGGGAPYGSYLPNPGLPTLLHKLTLPIVQRMVWNIKKGFLTKLVDLLRNTDQDYTLKKLIYRMKYIVPEIEGYLPTVQPALDITYTGPLIWNGFTKQNPLWLKQIEPNGKTVYISFGGTGFDKSKLINLSKKLAQTGYQVIVSCGSIAKISEFPKNKNLFVTNYLDGFTACKKSDVVICHGGYGTMMQAIISGKPVISIPFNPDQILHALRFQELGLGKCLFNPDLDFYINLIKGDWNEFEKKGKNLSVETIIHALEEIQNNKVSYQKNIIKYAKQINHKQSAKLAAEAVLHV